MANVQLNVGSGGALVATNAITRDTVTEQMELINIADPNSGACAPVDATNGVGVQLKVMLPAGTNLIGGAQIVDSAGTNKLAVDNTGKVGINNFPATQPVSGSVQISAGTAIIGTVKQYGCKYLNVNDASAHTIAGAVTLVGFQNLSAALQTTSITAYDNTAASGTPLSPAETLGAGQVITYPLGGIALTTGLTVQCAAAPAAPGIMVLYRD